MVQRILRINQDTLFKLRPEQASNLSDREKFFVSSGRTFEIQSYAYADISGDFEGHVRVALAKDFIRGLNTWFVFSLHIQIEFDGVVVFPHEEQVSIPILYVTRDTTVKRRPMQASVLEEDEKFELKGGQNFRLQSYAYGDSRGDFSSHIKFAIRSREDFLRGLSTWFIFDQHAYVEFDGVIVYPPEDPTLPILRINQDTFFKRRPLPASDLPANELYSAPRGSLWKLHSYAYADAQGNRFNGHIKFALRYEKDFIQQLSTWYVFEGHAQVEVLGKVVYPVPRPTPSPTPTPTPTFNGRPFKLPGNTSTFYTDQPIIPGGNFTWGEATREATRIPDTVEIVDNIVDLARVLQRARTQIGRPFQVNSWYRPPAINASVGGVPNSQHLFGRAVDIEVAGLSGRRVANALMPWWPGGIGIYPNMPDVVHLDTGSRRYWGF